MERRKVAHLVMLMVGSVILLIGLQAWWIRTEYRAAVDSFERETDLVFKSTVKHIADSTFYSYFSQYGINMDRDSTKDVASITLKRDSIYLNDSIKGHQYLKIDSARRKMLNISDVKNRMYFETEGPRIFKAQDRASGGYMNFIFDFGEKNINEDSLRLAFQESLSKPISSLKIKILSKKADQLILTAPNDSTPYSTSYYRLGRNFMYSAQFENAQFYIWKMILPQLGFSVVLSFLFIISFLVVYCSLKSQERLLVQKDDFIANMTHELKTPIATVGVALEAMKDFDVLSKPDKANEYIDMAMKELNRLGKLTDKVLNITIFDLHHIIQQEKSSILLKDCIDEMSKNMGPSLQQANADLILNIQSDGRMVGHAEHLSEMLHNLIENAIKYAAPSPQIELHLTESTDYFILEVVDNGPGIPEEHLVKVMERFYRVPSDNIHDVKGYGLGLSYVSRVVKSHKGQIKLENRKMGGLSVKITFPKL